MCESMRSDKARISMSPVMLGLVLVTIVSRADTRRMTVAAIFDEGGESQHEIAFKHAVEAVNRNRSVSECLLICYKYNLLSVRDSN